MTALICLYGFASEIGVRFRGSLCVCRGPLGVCFVSCRGPVGVSSGSTLADPDRTPKANPGSGLGPLSVRLGPVGTVSRGHAINKRKYCFYLERFVLTCILYYLESIPLPLLISAYNNIYSNLLINFMGFLPASPKAKAGLGVQSLRPSVRPSVCPSVRLSVRPSQNLVIATPLKLLIQLSCNLVCR